MTDYIKALADEMSPYHREAESLVKSLREGATITGGVIRWNSNGRVPPVECVVLAAHIGLPVDVTKCAAARDEEVSASINAYRTRMKNHVPSAEERFEMRAAFGEGAAVVNVLTGKRDRT